MKLRRVLLGLLVLCICWQPNIPSAGGSTSPRPLGKAAVLMDAASGRILYAQNSHAGLPPASLTKIMTGLLTVEAGDLERPITVSAHAAQIPESSIDLEAGESLTRRQLLYACLLHSGNDAATALAESVGGDEDSFVEIMNRRAQTLGMEDTHYRNPHGLHNSRHYSSAHDLALLTRQALTNAIFRQVVATRETSIPQQDGQRAVVNRNQLLGHYPGAIGVKTGYTREAGNCLVGAARRGNLTLIAVVMNSPQVYEDVKLLLDYGFAHYQLYTLKKAGQLTVSIPVQDGFPRRLIAALDTDLAIAVTPDEKTEITYKTFPFREVSSPVKEGTSLGVCKVYINGQEVSQVNLTAQATTASEAASRQDFLSVIWLPVLLAVGVAGYLLWRIRVR